MRLDGLRPAKNPLPRCPRLEYQRPPSMVAIVRKHSLRTGQDRQVLATASDGSWWLGLDGKKSSLSNSRQADCSIHTGSSSVAASMKCAYELSSLDSTASRSVLERWTLPGKLGFLAGFSIGFPFLCEVITHSGDSCWFGTRLGFDDPRFYFLVTLIS